MSGILLQRWKIYKLNIIHGKGLYWAAGYLAFIYLVPDSDIKSMAAMLILAAFTISIAYSKPGLATKWLNNRDISYGVYMYHGMLLTVLVDLGMIGSPWYLVLVAVVTFTLAWLSYKYIETPAMKLAKEKNKAHKAAAVKPPAPEPAPVQEELPVFNGHEQAIPVPQPKTAVQ
jgi:peptidoglycan/LPS O-acetylase OafA/YrhL